MAKREVERRCHKRFPLPCVARISTEGGGRDLRAKAVNISDGGMYLTVPLISPPPKRDEAVEVVFSLPRSTPNTRMLEEVRSTGRILRHQPLKNNRQARVALQFTQPLDLAVEV